MINKWKKFWEYLVKIESMPVDVDKLPSAAEVAMNPPKLPPFSESKNK